MKSYTCDRCHKECETYQNTIDDSDEFWGERCTRYLIETLSDCCSAEVTEMNEEEGRINGHRQA